MALTKSDLKEINKLLEQQRKAINQDIAQFMTEKIIPRLDQLGELSEDVKKTSIVVDRIERHLDKYEDRIERLEQIHPQGRHQAGV